MIDANYRPQRSWGKVIYSQASVILLTEGVSAPGGSWVWSRGVSALGGGVCSRGPGGDPPERLLLRAVRILLECILVLKKTIYLYISHIHFLQYFLSTCMLTKEGDRLFKAS